MDTESITSVVNNFSDLPEKKKAKHKHHKVFKKKKRRHSTDTKRDTSLDDVHGTAADPDGYGFAT